MSGGSVRETRFVSKGLVERAVRASAGLEMIDSSRFSSVCGLDEVADVGPGCALAPIGVLHASLAGIFR